MNYEEIDDIIDDYSDFIRSEGMMVYMHGKFTNTLRSSKIYNKPYLLGVRTVKPTIGYPPS